MTYLSQVIIAGGADEQLLRRFATEVLPHV